MKAGKSFVRDVAIRRRAYGITSKILFPAIEKEIFSVPDVVVVFVSKLEKETTIPILY